jgi:hypothetical protein
VRVIAPERHADNVGSCAPGVFANQLEKRECGQDRFPRPREGIDRHPQEFAGATTEYDLVWYDSVETGDPATQCPGFIIRISAGMLADVPHRGDDLRRRPKPTLVSVQPDRPAGSWRGRRGVRERRAESVPGDVRRGQRSRSARAQSSKQASAGNSHTRY